MAEQTNFGNRIGVMRRISSKRRLDLSAHRDTLHPPKINRKTRNDVKSTVQTIKASIRKCFVFKRK